MSVGIATGGFAGNVYPLSHPRIGWHRIAGTITANSEAAGFAAVNAGTYRTDSFWRAATLDPSPRWTIDAGSAVNVNYLGISAHDLGTQGATVHMESSTDNVTYTIRVTHVPADNSAILLLCATVSARYWRVRITNSVAAPTVGVIQFGPVTEFPQKCVYAPSISFDRTQQTTFSANITEGGQWAGRSIVRKSLMPSMEVNHLSEAWVADEWDAFVEHARSNPFFIADRPSAFPKSVAYAWTSDDLRAERQIPNAAVANSVSLSLTGFMA